ncbi:hypothetical protein TUZN_1643 [Thermoproteus uzoniensis 768-20]|uniref:PAE0736-like N-terminal domain-containing protein n=1 Tax=Thermoproteus uzoniensis (strain 768-20) TaxID=999630 RepID=F2L2Z0_THEU7|nr:DUF3195 domain-containing protein [Thermoproteus uzoniensis]AEA13109.1 hypothetical protein TUZN_1643 [Thermoproteus uzoniensis 768-20]
MAVILATTIGGKEAAIARDLCDCLYGQGDTAVVCEPISPGVFYAKFSDKSVLDRCLSMKYFKAMIKRVELYDGVSDSAPSQGYSRARRVGKYIFIKF